MTPIGGFVFMLELFEDESQKIKPVITVRKDNVSDADIDRLLAHFVHYRDELSYTDFKASQES